jgi:hypothetical protein
MFKISNKTNQSITLRIDSFAHLTDNGKMIHDHPVIPSSKETDYVLTSTTNHDGEIKLSLIGGEKAIILGEIYIKNIKHPGDSGALVSRSTAEGVDVQCTGVGRDDKSRIITAIISQVKQLA